MKKILKFTFVLILICISGITYTNTSGPSGGLTGAPSEGNCTSCHAGSAITAGTAYSSITLTGIPAGGYIPGTAYTLTLGGGTAATAKNGFQITALNASNAMAGTFTAGTGSQSITSGARSYLGHTSAGTSLSSYTFNWTAPSTAAGLITFYVSYNGSNNNSSDVGDAIYVKSFSFNVGNLPTASITGPANNAVFCLGDTVKFTGTATNNPTAYYWQFLGNSPASSALQNPAIVFTQAGYTTVRLTAANASGTSPVTSIIIQVVAKPTATISVSPSQVVCGNDSVTLSANIGTGLSYLWSPGNMTTPSVKIGSAGTYSVKVTNSAGCFKMSNSISTTYTSKPIMLIQTNTDTICEKDSLIFGGSFGFNLYRFFIDGVQVDSISNSSKWIKLNAGTHVVGVKGFNGYCNSDLITKNIIVYAQDPAPSIACGASTSSSIVFTVGNSNAQLSLDSGNTWISPNNGLNHVITGLLPNQSKNVWVRTASNSPCLYSVIGNKTCIASSCQPISMQLLYPKNMCSNGTNYLIKVLSTNAVNPYYKYSQPPVAPFGFTKIDSFRLSTSFGQTITVSVIDSANVGCGVRDSVINIPTVTVFSPSVINQAKLTVCGNDTFSFDVKPYGTIEDIVKMLSNTGTEIASKTITQGLHFGPFSASLFASNNQFKLVALDTASGCSSMPNIKTVKINAPAQAKIQAFKDNLNIELRDTTAASVSRSWTYGDGNSNANTGRTQLHTYTSAGSYKVVLSIVDGNNCNNSDSITLNIVATGLQNAGNNDLFTMYPNPVSNAITLEWQGNKNASITLLDENGKSLFAAAVENAKPISLAGLAQGVYLLKFELGSDITYRKIVIN